MRRQLEDKNVRKLFKRGGSYAVTLPIELVEKLKWRSKQKVVVKRQGKKLIIEDWKK